MSARQQCILVMAGGTGGHVFPGLAVARNLEQQGWRIHWLGTAKRMEAKLIPAEGIDISYIDVVGVRGNGIVRLLKAPFQIARSVLQAIKVIRQIKPDVVLGMGGFASGPGGLAARLMGKPLVVHEQNAVAGMTNRILARIANSVLQAFPGAFKSNASAKTIGNPVRKDLLKTIKPEHRINQHKATRILVVGGSSGAAAFNQHIPAAMTALAKEFEIEVTHQAGADKGMSVSEAYSDSGVNVEVCEFINDMSAAYQQADLLICRAGALTVAEVAAIGVPAIFIPMPAAVDDHQTKNALALVELGGALLLPQAKLIAGELITCCKELLIEPGKLLAMAQAARDSAITDATEQVAAECKQLAAAN